MALINTFHLPLRKEDLTDKAEAYDRQQLRQAQNNASAIGARHGRKPSMPVFKFTEPKEDT